MTCNLNISKPLLHLPYQYISQKEQKDLRLNIPYPKRFVKKMRRINDWQQKY